MGRGHKQRFRKVIHLLSAPTQPAQKINVTKLHLRLDHNWRYEGIRRDQNAEFKIKNRSSDHFHMPQANTTEVQEKGVLRACQWIQSKALAKVVKNVKNCERIVLCDYTYRLHI